MTPILRRDIYWVNLPKAHTLGGEQRTESDGPRAWVIVSRASVQASRGIVIAVPLSAQIQTQKDFLVARVLLEEGDVLLKNTPQIPLKLPLVALTEQVRVLACERLEGDPVGEVIAEKMSEIEAGLLYVLKLD